MPTRLTATTYDGAASLCDVTRMNAERLHGMGVRVLHDVDATRLDKACPGRWFEVMIFQFPNAGSRQPNRGHNPNFVLMRRFLKSALTRLCRHGEILVSTVDSAYYDGRFRLDEAAEYAGLDTPLAVPFSFAAFPAYHHVNTNDEDSAIDPHGKFLTWIFKAQ